MKLLLLSTLLLLPISVQAKGFDIEDDCRDSLSNKNNININTREKIEDALEDRCKDAEKESNERFNQCLFQVLDGFNDNGRIGPGEENDLIKCYEKDEKKRDDDDNDGGGKGGIASDALFVTKIDQLDFDFIDDDEVREDVVKELEKCEDEDMDKVVECARDVVLDEFEEE
jgi:hypothetical protein